MKIEIETLFWDFDQNNSGGYFVEDDKNGVCEYVIIEAVSYDEAWGKLKRIGDDVSDFWDYCSCCGERWYSWEKDGNENPSIYGENIDTIEEGAFRKRCFVHYYDGTIKEFKFKK